MSANQDDRTYFEKLRDPRWQRKRLEIMQRDGFRCVECGRDDITLNVHHLRYVRGAAPWDVPSAALVTLCEECHTIYHSGIGSLSCDSFFNALYERGGDWGHLIDMAVTLHYELPPEFRLSADEWRYLLEGFKKDVRAIAQAHGYRFDWAEVMKDAAQIVAAEKKVQS